MGTEEKDCESRLHPSKQKSGFQMDLCSNNFINARKNAIRAKRRPLGSFEARFNAIGKVGESPSERDHRDCEKYNRDRIL